MDPRTPCCLPDGNRPRPPAHLPEPSGRVSVGRIHPRDKRGCGAADGAAALRSLPPRKSAARADPKIARPPGALGSPGRQPHDLHSEPGGGENARPGVGGASRSMRPTARRWTGWPPRILTSSLWPWERGRICATPFGMTPSSEDPPDLAPTPVVDPDLGEGLSVSGRRPLSLPDGLHRVAGDRFSSAPAPRCIPPRGRASDPSPRPGVSPKERPPFRHIRLGHPPSPPFRIQRGFHSEGRENSENETFGSLSLPPSESGPDDAAERDSGKRPPVLQPRMKSPRPRPERPGNCCHQTSARSGSGNRAMGRTWPPSSKTAARRLEAGGVLPPRMRRRSRTSELRDGVFFRGAAGKVRRFPEAHPARAKFRLAARLSPEPNKTAGGVSARPPFPGMDLGNASLPPGPPGARPALSARLNPPTERLRLPPLLPHVRLSRAFLSGRPGDRRGGPSGSGLRPHRRGVPSGRSLPAPIRRPGRFPETPGPRKTGRAFGGAGGLGVPGPWTGGRPEGAAFAPCGRRLAPEAGGPAAVRRSLPQRSKPSRNFIPAGDAGRRAAAHPRLAGACPNRAPSLFRSPPPSCRPLAPLAGGVEGARAPSSGLRPCLRAHPRGFRGVSRGIPGEATRIWPPRLNGAFRPRPFAGIPGNPG
jgi:hypothetical protein